MKINTGRVILVIEQKLIYTSYCRTAAVIRLPSKASEAVHGLRSILPEPLTLSEDTEMAVLENTGEFVLDKCFRLVTYSIRV
mmetsp:Transcript_16642/g.33686  ORF Transcript_16642/g.33686 Transcript_16642/m.33686 type:complete len:82 (-) Transcript_16642:1379-1624(-)